MGRSEVKAALSLSTATPKTLQTHIDQRTTTTAYTLPSIRFLPNRTHLHTHFHNGKRGKSLIDAVFLPTMMLPRRRRWSDDKRQQMLT